MTDLRPLLELAQSVWLDFVSRELVRSGELAKLVSLGVRGLTSNPTILERAVRGSADYDDDIRRLAREGRSALEIYEHLAVADLAGAADVLRPVWEASRGGDGYVSIEVNPALARDTGGTVVEARRLADAIGRPNVMVKVPGTREGARAVEQLTAEGRSVNVTLLFSFEQYEEVAEAYVHGLERLVESMGDPARVASVASFFVSRIDTAVDRILREYDAGALAGTAAVASAKTAYARFREVFRGARWARLAERGARVQRLLWGSTSTKDPAYPDTMYVDELIGRDTVNTVPPVTLRAVLDHGRATPSLESGLDEAYAHLTRLAEAGVDLDGVAKQLLEEGIAAFAKSFEDLVAGIEGKRAEFLRRAA
ncbi:MAG: transaldolase [Planctomycetota bacterium]